MKFLSQLFFISILIFSFPKNTSAQNWAGFETGRFSGISSANQRPASMAPMPFKVDATLFGLHLNTQPKNLFSKDFLDVALSGGFKNLTGFNELRDKTSVFSNLQVPSVQVQAHERVSLAFSWNVRYLWFSELTEPRMAQLFNPDLESLELQGENETVNVLYTGWDEFGLGVAGVVWKDGFHSISVGGFAKLVYGTGHMDIAMQNVNVDASGNRVNHADFSVDATVTDAMSELVDDGTLRFADKAGYGFDFGFEYKFLNPRSCPGASNARAKAGFSITDMGKAFYHSATHSTKTNASADSISRDVFHNSFANTTDTLQQIFELNEQVVSDFNVTLPMSMRVYTEVNIRRRWVVYGEFHFLFTQLTHPDMPMYFRFNVTPRFEDDRFGIYLPLTTTNYTPFDAGLALRLKPLVFGSGNLFSFWAYEERGKALDFYVTLKIPILNDNERIDWKTMNRKRR